MKRIVIPALAAALVLGGCVSPFETKKRSSVDSAEELSTRQTSSAARSFTGSINPLPPLEIKGDDNKIEFSSPPLPATITSSFSGGLDSEAGSSVVWTSEYVRYLPLGFSLIFIAIGVLLLLYAWKALKRSSATVSAASGVADTALANVISSLRKRVAAAAPAEANIWQAEVADLEKQRGKLKSQFHGK